MDKITVEQWLNSDTMPNTYPIWTGLGVNTSPRRQRPATDRLSRVRPQLISVYIDLDISTLWMEERRVLLRLHVTDVRKIHRSFRII